MCEFKIVVEKTSTLSRTNKVKYLIQQSQQIIKYDFKNIQIKDKLKPNSTHTLKISSAPNPGAL